MTQRASKNRSSGARKGRQTGRKSKLLENSVHAVKLRGFHIFENIDEFERGTSHERSVIYNFPHTTLWGTRGRKEAVIVCPPVSGFELDDDGVVRIVIEAKFQDDGGSVDEKLPYVWLSFLKSSVHNWIVILDGRFWRDKRGKEAADWLRKRPLEDGVPSGRTFAVLTPREFIDVVGKTWK